MGDEEFQYHKWNAAAYTAITAYITLVFQYFYNFNDWNNFHDF